MHIFCASARRLSHQAWKSVDGSGLWVSSQKKGIYKKKLLYFTHLPRSPPWADLHKFGTAVGATDVITCTQFFGDRLRDVDFVGEGRKLPSPVDKAGRR